MEYAYDVETRERERQTEKAKAENSIARLPLSGSIHDDSAREIQNCRREIGRYARPNMDRPDCG